MGMSFSSRALMRPICAIPLAPPPLRTSPTFWPLAGMTGSNGISVSSMILANLPMIFTPETKVHKKTRHSCTESCFYLLRAWLPSVWQRSCRQPVRISQSQGQGQLQFQRQIISTLRRMKDERASPLSIPFWSSARSISSWTILLPAAYSE